MNIPLNVCCNSSNLKGWGYDEPTKQLAVAFASGALWIYRDVPPEKAKGFEDAESVGRYFATEIKGMFEGAQYVEPDDPRQIARQDYL